MRKKTSGHWALGVLIATGTLIGALVVIEALFAPLAWLRTVAVVTSIRSNLPAARDRWRSHETTDYTIDVKGFVPLACTVNATLSVREGELVAVEERARQLGRETSEGVSIEPEGWDTPFCSYRELLVPGMYARIERELDRSDWSLERLDVQFDPEYGYVTEYKQNCCYRRGLLNALCSDCNTRFSFSNFEPFPDP